MTEIIQQADGGCHMAGHAASDVYTALGMLATGDMPAHCGWYWCQVGVVNNGLPDLAKVHIDKFDRLTAQFCGSDREFTEDELMEAIWLGPIPMPIALLDYLDDLPF